MGREWYERNDAAVISWQSKSGRHGGSGIALRCSESYNETHWRTQTFGRIDDEIVTSVRPLVVIDPEDREQVKRLYDLYYRAMPGNGRDQMQAALREFASPPPTVLTHYIATRDVDGVLRSVCGKVWKPSEASVSDGKCETCVAHVEAGWVK